MALFSKLGTDSIEIIIILIARYLRVEHGDLLYFSI